MTIHSKANWLALPVGRAVTLTEAAELIGINRETLRKYYCNEKRLPRCVQAIKEGRRTIAVERVY